MARSRRIWLTAAVLGSFFSFVVFSSSNTQATLLVTTDPFGSYDANGLSPFWDWKTVESPHFRVTYPVELREVAQKTTGYLEEAHRILSPLLRWQPSNRTQILLIDNQDAANGLTTAVLRYGIVLWVTPPDTWMGTEFYDDWLRLLVIHEYTHLLNIDTTTGFFKVLRYFAGDTLLPNSVWPPWMLEGLAVYMETRFTQAGRGRGSFYEMMLRAAVEEKKLNSSSFITLDKINGTNPYYPGGDTRYQFGYALMNQITKQNITGLTFDKRDSTTGGDDLLGIMSKRSGGRIPFFINGNLENITGKDWYKLWNEWVAETNVRMTEQLRVIHTQPVTEFTPLLDRDNHISNDVSGSALSPDGRWIAYTLVSADTRQGLYLRDLPTGKTEKLDDKIFGVGMKFTPDSRALIYSVVERKDNYSLLSDLAVYLLDDGSHHLMTYQKRARDPDVSRDGRWVTYTLTRSSVNEIAVAPLIHHSRRSVGYTIGPAQVLFTPAQYDHVANPQFSADGKKIYFSYHANGKPQEDIVELDVASRNIRSLISDGFYNRYPAVDGDGHLYFVSNKTGVDNLYRYLFESENGTNALAGSGQAGFRATDSVPIRSATKMVTNMTTGLFFPAFVPRKSSSGGTVGGAVHQGPTQPTDVYASVFSTSGGGLAKITLTDRAVSPQSVTVSRPPAPPISRLAVSNLTTASREKAPAAQVSSTKNKSVPTELPPIYPEKDYSVIPSIWPRSWYPFIGADPNGTIIGGQLYGFDATNRHRYIVAGSYQSQLGVGDAFALYSNRSLGPEIRVSSDILTTNVNLFSSPNPLGNLGFYSRQIDFSTAVTFPFLQTYSSLFAYLGYNWQKVLNYQMSSQGTAGGLASVSPIVPSLDAVVGFSNIETSNLAITGESGRTTQLGVRRYFNGPRSDWKVLFLEEEYFSITEHAVLNPSIKATWVSQTNPMFEPSNAVSQGRIPQYLVNVFPTDSFTQISLRGYPNRVYFSKAAAVFALDFQFPISRIFRGFGTLPVFFDNFYGFTFVEATYFPYATPEVVLPSLGGGLRLTTELFLYPITLSTEYHQGLRPEYGGVADLFVQALVTVSQF